MDQEEKIIRYRELVDKMYACGLNDDEVIEFEYLAAAVDRILDNEFLRDLE